MDQCESVRVCTRACQGYVDRSVSGYVWISVSQCTYVPGWVSVSVDQCECIPGCGKVMWTKVCQEDCGSV